MLSWVLVATRAFGVLFLCLTAAAPAQSPVLLDAMSEELDRNFTALKTKADPAPYFLSYEITEDDSHVVSATLGALNANAHSKTRRLDVCVRVGSPQLDNYHRVRGERPQFTSGAVVTFEDLAFPLQHRIWLETDRAYRLAAERLIKIKTNAEVKVAEQDGSGDFSSEEPVKHVETVPHAKFAAEAWAARLKKLSERFGDFPTILTSGVGVSYLEQTKYFVSSEGSRLEHVRGFARVVISAQAKAMDGTDLLTSETFEATDHAGLPRDEAIAAAVDRVAADLKALLAAPEAEPFAGPAIFSGRAAAVFFHEIFGHRIEGHRQKDEAEG